MRWLTKYNILIRVLLSLAAAGIAQDIDANKYHGGYYDGYAAASYTATAEVLQIACDAGWSLISSPIAPRDPYLPVLMSSVSSHLTIMKNGSGQVYWPAYNINIINEWQTPQGFLLYLTARDTLIFSGRRVLPENTPLSLASGWNMVAYLNSGALLPANAFSSISSHLVIAKNGAGQVYWPAYTINTIGSLTPGAGYQVYVDQTCILTYPANTGMLKSLAAVAEHTSTSLRYFTGPVAATGDNAILLVLAPELPEGSEIGAWSSGKVVGAGMVHQGKALLVLQGKDDLQTGAAGAAAGGAIILSCWRADAALEIPLLLTNLRDGLTQAAAPLPLIYRSNSVWVAETAGLSGLPVDLALLQNFPNPFNPETRIRYTLPGDVRVVITVCNLAGAMVRSLAEGSRSAGAHEISWDGQDDQHRIVPSGVYWVLLKAGNQTRSLKISLIR
ncbi:MAG TPA: FlgD immunoglobulin-like domain containing protein [bacterium]|nr:FlgD immunoglobulin-like domain containing protein [bacterium]HPR89139.1 FlgD immunoglobulin-like domain containing protein [bacterium]